MDAVTESFVAIHSINRCDILRTQFKIKNCKVVRDPRRGHRFGDDDNSPLNLRQKRKEEGQSNVIEGRQKWWFKPDSESRAGQQIYCFWQRQASVWDPAANWGHRVWPWGAAVNPTDCKRWWQCLALGRMQLTLPGSGKDDIRSRKPRKRNQIVRQGRFGR